MEGQPLEGPPLAGGSAPRLIAQCSKTAAGKLKFELLADLPGFTGAPAELAFQGPWIPIKGELFPPRLDKVAVTMEFLGYTKVKPMKQQWEYPLGAAGLIRYAPPGTGSSNMEEAAYFLRYMRSLPLFRITLPGKGSEQFATEKWQAAVKAEPLCAASGL